jgi:penicillin-binding protein 1A
MRTLGRFLAAIILGGVGLALCLALLTPGARALAAGGRPGGGKDLSQLGELAERSVVYAKDGSVLAVLHDEENRLPVPLSKVPPIVIRAVIDVEDNRFYAHGGLDLRGTARALLTNAQTGGVKEGGSTITQQLVKNSLLTPERSVHRKVEEAVLAIRLENHMTKQQILERYLNTVYLGNGAYGVEAASEQYFGRDVSQLGAAEAAFLAGTIRNPVGYDPILHKDAALARRNTAIDLMAQQGDVPRGDVAPLKAIPIPTALLGNLPKPNDYFVEAVKNQLLQDKRLGATPQDRYNAVFRGGLRIRTTLDPALQTIAKEQVKNIVPDTPPNAQQRALCSQNEVPVERCKFTAALVSVDSTTGAVRAVVGGRNFDDEKYNLAFQGHRQPGSSFKPIVLAAALDAGYSPNDTISGSSPCTIKVPGFDVWRPGNYEGERAGTINLVDATAHSINCAYAHLAVSVGLDKVTDMAHKLGITSHLDPYPSMSLGAEEVTPLEMAGVYDTFANDGVHHDPYIVEQVEDRKGKVVFKGATDAKRVLSSQVNRMQVTAMRAVVERGTGTKARLPGRDVAGKTGTSENWENAWFDGFTPQLTTVVWMGSPAGNVPMRNVGGIQVVGGSYPARIWQAYMSRALAGVPSVSMPRPNPSEIPAGKYIRDGGRTSSSSSSRTTSRYRRGTVTTTKRRSGSTINPNPKTNPVFPPPATP